MRKQWFWKLFFACVGCCIVIPAFQLILWSVAERWPWPGLLPESLSLRTARELLFGSSKLPRLLLSSICLGLAVAFLGTVVGILTARATALYRFRGKELVSFGAFLPLLVPGTVFAMGIQVTLIRMGLSDTVAGVVLVHLIAAVPYCITIMTDVTRSVGARYEQQAMVLGAGPLRAFFEGTLPGLLPGILASMSMGFILSYSQYFTTLMVGGGRIKTIALVLIPYIQSGDRALSSVYCVAFVGSALVVFHIFESLIQSAQKREGIK